MTNREVKAAAAWPRQPFVGIAIAAVLGIAVGDKLTAPVVGLLLTVACAAMALLSKQRLLFTYLFVAASFFSLQSLRQTYSAGTRLAHEFGAERTAITARGVVASEPRVSARGTSSFLFRLEELQQRDRTLRINATVSANWKGDVQFGDELQLFGVIQSIAGPRNPGEFDMRAYLARRDIRHALIVRYPENGKLISRGGGNPVMRAAQRSRRWMQAALARGLEDSPELHGLLSTMVLGAREETAEEIEEQFQQTGTIHLFSVSGLHVGMVAYLLWTLATTLRISRPWAVAVIIPTLFFYAAITGFSVASVRAATMAAVLLGGYFVDRKVLAGNSLAAAAVLILMVDPNQLFSTGFQLSFAVVATLILLADPLFHLFVKWSAPDPFLPRSLLSPMQRTWRSGWQTFSRGASVSLAAWIGSLPLILPHFYLVTPVALVANMVVVPIAFCILAVGLISLLLTAVTPGLAVVFNNANWSLASMMLGAVGLLSRAPAGHHYLEWPPWRTAAPVELCILDAEAGGAMHVRSRGHDWLFDPGGARHFKRFVRGYLRSRGTNRLDGMLLTHGDSLHIGGALAVWHAFHPREIIDSAAVDRSSVRREFVAWLQERAISRQICATGDEWNLSRELAVRVVFPPPNHKGRTADDQALVTQLIVKDRWRVLLMSDSGEETERLLRDVPDLNSHIVIKGQHHTGKSGSMEFLDRVQPELIVASAPAFPENERLKPEWTEALKSRGTKLLRQDETGAVTLRFYRDRWEASSHLSSEIVRSITR